MITTGEQTRLDLEQAIEILEQRRHEITEGGTEDERITTPAWLWSRTILSTVILVAQGARRLL